MEEIEMLKKKNKKLASDIVNDKNAIFLSIGIILMIIFACLGSGVVLGLILSKMTKAIALSIGVSVLASLKSMSNIVACNRDINDCMVQINANNSEIKKLENLLKREKQKTLETKKEETKSKQSYKTSGYSKKEEEFTKYLEELKDDNFFDFDNSDSNHKVR